MKVKTHFSAAKDQLMNLILLPRTHINYAAQCQTKADEKIALFLLVLCLYLNYFYTFFGRSTLDDNRKRPKTPRGRIKRLLNTYYYNKAKKVEIFIYKYKYIYCRVYMESTKKSETKVVWKCRAEQLVALVVGCWFLALAESTAWSRKQKWLWKATRVSPRVRKVWKLRYSSSPLPRVCLPPLVAATWTNLPHAEMSDPKALNP